MRRPELDTHLFDPVHDPLFIAALTYALFLAFLLWGLTL